MSNAIETQGTQIGILGNTETVSATFNATTKKIVRSTGDWTAKFKVNDIVTSTDTDNPGPFMITALTATDMTVEGKLTTDATAASFAFTEYKKIGEIVDFKGPGGSASVIDVSSLDSKRKEKRLGLPDEGQITFNLNFIPGDTGQVLFRAKRAARSIATFIIVFSDGTDTTNPSTAIFDGFAAEFSTSGGVDDKVAASATIEITGEVNWSDD